MRTALLLLIAMLVLDHPAPAQINAGDIPTGTIAVDPGIDLLLNTPLTIDTATFDLNCDGLADMKATLVQGDPGIDAENRAFLYPLNPAVELCQTILLFYPRPRSYAFGQPLVCTIDYAWDGGVLVLGDFGSWEATGPEVVDSMYVAYRLDGIHVGWILLSFNVHGPQQVRFLIHEVLQICTDNAVAEYGVPPMLSLFPNPADGAVVRVESPFAVQHLEVLDATGKILTRYGAGVRTIAAPEVAGTYLVCATFSDGRRSFARLVHH